MAEKLVLKLFLNSRGDLEIGEARRAVAIVLSWISDEDLNRFGAVLVRAHDDETRKRTDTGRLVIKDA